MFQLYLVPEFANYWTLRLCHPKIALLCQKEQPFILILHRFEGLTCWKTAPLRSCQHRLKYAKNPSAVVMIAIRGVAAKVGRRYYGSRETAEGDEAQDVGELKM